MQCHLLVYGIDSSYNPWVSHRESGGLNVNNEDDNKMEASDNDNDDDIPFDDMAALVFDSTNAYNESTNYEVPSDGGNPMEFGSSSGNDETPNKELITLLEDMEAKLYLGCKKFKRLEFLITLIHIKEFSNEEKCPKCSTPTWKEKVVQGGDVSSGDEDEDHKWRRSRNLFGGKVGRGPPPTPLTGHDVLEQLSGYSNVEFGKGVTRKRKRGEQYIIIKLWKDGDKRITEELFCLERGPMKRVVSYDGYIINGFRFHTKKRQRNRKTQNSGVVVRGDEESGEKNFYGILEEVIVLEYGALKNRTSPKVVLFKCKWFDVFSDGKEVKRDNLEAVLINVTRRLRTNESFALDSQIEQVFYVTSHNETN
uniref:DUF4216 domain-containing protein n=1 Tax=Chenopodium quinoa TaxID=63459 RepID=A0A803NAG7_CHEQI